MCSIAAEGADRYHVHWAGTPIDKSQILTVKCDVLIPAAVCGVITEDNAASLNCRFVVEAANVSMRKHLKAVTRFSYSLCKMVV